MWTGLKSLLTSGGTSSRIHHVTGPLPDLEAAPSYQEDLAALVPGHAQALHHQDPALGALLHPAPRRRTFGGGWEKEEFSNHNRSDIRLSEVESGLPSSGPGSSENGSSMPASSANNTPAPSSGGTGVTSGPHKPVLKRISMRDTAGGADQAHIDAASDSNNNNKASLPAKQAPAGQRTGMSVPPVSVIPGQPAGPTVVKPRAPVSPHQHQGKQQPDCGDQGSAQGSAGGAPPAASPHAQPAPAPSPADQAKPQPPALLQQLLQGPVAGLGAPAGTGCNAVPGGNPQQTNKPGAQGSAARPPTQLAWGQPATSRAGPRHVPMAANPLISPRIAPMLPPQRPGAAANNTGQLPPIQPGMGAGLWGGPLIRVDNAGPGQVPSGAMGVGAGGLMRSAQSFSAASRPRVYGQQQHRMVVVRYEDLRLIQQIGEGGFGKVYYGHLQSSPVAIKVATLRAGADMGALVTEFRREVSTMQAIPPHPNILRMIAWVEEPPNLALVTEYCARGSLYSLLHNPSTPKMSLKQLLPIWLGIARGMAHLHAASPPVLHRDLKSANLLLDDVGQVKIADFGLSKLYADVQALTGGLGTYQWMAPEVLAHQRYSQKADVYSFAIVLWECLTRQLPYQGMTAVQAAVGVVNHGLRPDIPSDQELPAELVALIRACWAAVPDQRPSFEEIVQRLQALVDEESSSGRSRQTVPGATAAAAASATTAQGEKPLSDRRSAPGKLPGEV